ncbi:hypothetical protein MKZ38_010469 [Zalerion maritima]|uniref:Uncharacterized protein n=1 Tax=Zalerion maritima TaxID=339359 RepID=A0AAD5RSE2_9PEZI|nr:hypothetical protein MKZ38_010469 [Zalerion maritima]
MADNVFIGIWQNSSNPGIGGAILTTGDTRGQILVSVLTLFVTIAGGYLWSLVSLAIYARVVTRNPKAHRSAGGGVAQPDGLDLQQQVILRNTTNAFSSAVDFVRVWWAWRKVIGHHSSSKRTAVPLFVSMFVWLVVFAIATMVPIFISSGEDAGEQVLVLMRDRESRCGSLDFGQLDPAVVDYDLAKNASVKVIGDLGRARQVVFDQLISDKDRASAVKFPKPSLPSYLTKNMSCPVVNNASRCALGAETAVEVTSGPLDSFEMFGINEEVGKRITFERKAVCSPLDINDLFYSQTIDGLDYSFITVDMGLDPAQSFNMTYWAPKVAYPANNAYSLKAQVWLPDYPWPSMLTWSPSPSFLRTDADITALFLDSNGIVYTDKVADPFFEANDYSVESTFEYEGNAEESVTSYRSDYWVRAMYCAEQYSVCNVRNGRCVNPMGIAQLLLQVNNTHLDLNPSQRVSAMRIISAASNFPIAQVTGLGGDALLASRKVSFWGMSSPLPDDQWMQEVHYWFNMSLTGMQIAVQEYADSPRGEEYGTTLLPGAEGFAGAEKGPNSDYGAFIEAGKTQCGLQLMRSVEGVVNFKMLYVTWVVVICALFCLLGWTIEPMLTALIRWKWKWNSTWRKARIADDQLQLLRMAVETVQKEIGWEAAGHDGGLPVTSGKPPPRLTRPEFDGTKVSYKRVYESVPLTEVQTQYNPPQRGSVATSTYSTYFPQGSTPSFSSQAPLWPQQRQPSEPWSPLQTAPFGPDQNSPYASSTFSPGGNYGRPS